MLRQIVILAISAATLTLGGSPVESGNWVEDYPDSSVQQCAGGSGDGNTYYIPESPNGSTDGSGCSNGHLRAETRYDDDYSSGVHQFGGEFSINSMSGDRISIKQTFNGDDGPYFILAVKQGGTLYSVEGGDTIADSVATVGATVQINTVHDADNHQFRVYVNANEVYTDDNAPGGTFYDKIGAYTTNSGSGDLSVTWNDVQFWHLE